VAFNDLPPSALTAVVVVADSGEIAQAERPPPRVFRVVGVDRCLDPGLGQRRTRQRPEPLGLITAPVREGDLPACFQSSEDFFQDLPADPPFRPGLRADRIEEARWPGPAAVGWNVGENRDLPTPANWYHPAGQVLPVGGRGS
jgi:hypothetical protein